MINYIGLKWQNTNRKSDPKQIKKGLNRLVNSMKIIDDLLILVQYDDYHTR